MFYNKTKMVEFFMSWVTDSIIYPIFLIVSIIGVGFTIIFNIFKYLRDEKAKQEHPSTEKRIRKNTKSNLGNKLKYWFIGLLRKRTHNMPDISNKPIIVQGGIFDGETVNGVAHGQGRVAWESGDFYDGEFSNGMIHGQGRLAYADGSYHKGEFDSGQFHGWGIFTSAVGSRQEGSWVNSRREGYFTITNPDGTTYIAIFENGELISTE